MSQFKGQQGSAVCSLVDIEGTDFYNSYYLQMSKLSSRQNRNEQASTQGTGGLRLPECASAEAAKPRRNLNRCSEFYGPED
jgi:hypothetical protein